MSDEQRTALVVLPPGPSAAGTPPERRAEAAPARAHVDEVIAGFRRRGFETGPFVGRSFAITGSEDLFHDVFGDTSALDAGGEGALPLDALTDDLATRVEAVVVTRPPDFGPGNP